MNDTEKEKFKKIFERKQLESKIEFHRDLINGYRKVTNLLDDKLFEQYKILDVLEKELKDDSRI